jgi:hypothetical protein
MQGEYYKKEDLSTAERFYDLDESQRQYEQLLQENVWLKQQVQRSRIEEQTSNCHNCRDCSHQEREVSSGGDIALWGVLERNKYLENKIDKLKSTFQRQSKTISSIRSSEKWKSRFQCSSHGSSCYEDKYLQLLRVRSPFY